jgi:hypothetical protein
MQTSLLRPASTFSDHNCDRPSRSIADEGTSPYMYDRRDPSGDADRYHSCPSYIIIGFHTVFNLSESCTNSTRYLSNPSQSYDFGTLGKNIPKKC